MHIPLPIRAGGSFLALTLVLVIFLVVSVFSDGWMANFEVTPRTLLIVAAAAILGAFATVRRDQVASRSQVVALATGVGLIALSMLIPPTPIYVMQQYWLALYAAAALVCALILRRSAM